MLTFQENTFGIYECRLDLKLLFSAGCNRGRFEKVWPEFLASDPSLPQLCRIEGDQLIYRTESFVPEQRDERPPLLLLLGNPASHSVLSGMCFAFEGNHREHRFWITLRETGLFSFLSDRSSSPQPWAQRNKIREKELRLLRYSSPFRLGIAVYFSMPSAASDPRWSGVAGLLRLFGSKALRAVSLEEGKRIASILRSFMAEGGGIIAFQKDAYEGVRSSDTPPYSIELAKTGQLYGKCKHAPRILLVGAPPTRFLHGGKCRQALKDSKDYLVSRLSPHVGS